MPTRIKICGITSLKDASAAVHAGADAIGLVFYDKSPRVVDLEMAAKIAIACGPFVSVVGLFVDATVKKVNAVLNAVPLHVLQFHGDEDSDYCLSFKRPYLKAIRVRESDTKGNVAEQIAKYRNTSGILLDTYSKKAAGGTGEAFNWESVPIGHDIPIVLAGGLHSENVAEAIQKTHPYAVDVSSGVEKTPGVKDIKKLKQFIDRVRISG